VLTFNRVVSMLLLEIWKMMTGDGTCMIQLKVHIH